MRGELFESSDSVAANTDVLIRELRTIKIKSTKYFFMLKTKLRE